jgi:hypothetical protein
MKPTTDPVDIPSLILATTTTNNNNNNSNKKFFGGCFAMDNPFARVEPEVFDPTLYCPQVEAMLTPGNWVVFTNDDTNFESEEDQDVCVGLILKTDASKEEGLQVNVFIKLTKVLKALLRIRLDNNPSLQWIPHILRTTRSKWITAKSVSSIAWVFNPVVVLDRRPNEGYQGMSNLFLLAYDDTGGPIVTGCHSFCSGYSMYSLNLPDCYQERVWNGIQTLRAEISRHLGRYSEKQGSYTRVSSNIVMGKEAWRYLVLKVKNVVRQPLTRLGSTTKRLLQPGLLLRSTPIHGNSTMLRFETQAELAILSSVLGELVTVEVRKRRPKYGVVDSLHVNDVINVVAGSEEREEPFRHRTAKQGIDLIFDGTHHLRIRMRYQRYQYVLPVGDSCPSAILRRALARKMPLRADESGASSSSDDGEETSDDDDSLDAAVVDHAAAASVGMEFTIRDVLYRIRSIGSNPGLVTAVVHWPKADAGRVDTFDLWRVERWIQHNQSTRGVYNATI